MYIGEKIPAGTSSAAGGVSGNSPLRPPKTLTLAITGACNLQCRHCWVDSGASPSAPPVPTATLLRLIEEFAALGGEGIRFTGGEPLSHPDWLELLQSAVRSGFPHLFLQTNGILLRDEDAAALRRLDFPGLAVQISLDGATAATHDRVRGEGAFEAALSGIVRLVRAGLAPRITLAFTEMGHNLEEFPALLDLAEELGLGAVVAGTLVRGGRGAAGSPVAPPEPGRYLRLVRRYQNDSAFRDRYERLGKMAALEWWKEEVPRSECCTFVENPYLTAHGVLYPCVLCHADQFAVSRVFEKTLAGAFAEGVPLWASLMRLSRLRSAGIARCAACPGRPACAGGCMGRAWGSCGDLLAADDRCEMRQSLYALKNSVSPPER